MTDEVLESYVRQLIESQTRPRNHRGLAGWRAYPHGPRISSRRSVELESKYATSGTAIEHTIQTNGTLLDDGVVQLLSGA